MENKGKVSFGFIRKAFAGALMGAAALVATTAQAEVQGFDDLYAVYNGNNDQGTRLLRNGTFTIVLTLADDVKTVNTTSGKPYILLDNIKNFANNTGMDFRAEFAGYDGNDLYFNYTIQAGDYSSGVDLMGNLHLNGAIITVQTSDGAENLPELPLPSLFDFDYTLQISTFYFWQEGGEPTNTVFVSSKKAKVGAKFSEDIYCKASVSSEVKFKVSVLCEDDDAEFEIYQGDSRCGTINAGDKTSCDISLPTDGMMTVGATPQKETDERIRVRIRPAAAGGDSSADLYIVYENGVEEEMASIKKISVVTADNTVYGYNKPIRILVEFTHDIRGVESSPPPMLELNVMNRNNATDYSATSAFKKWAVYDTTRPYNGSKMYFTYTVKAGDYIDKLDVTDCNFAQSIEFKAPFDYVVPSGADTASLASNSNVGIQTILFDGFELPTANITIEEGQSYNLVVKRGGPAEKEQRFSVTSEGTNGVTLKSGDYISYTTPFSIAANQPQETMVITAEEPGTQILRLRPYDGTTDGELVATITVTPGSLVPTVQLSGISSVEEGAEPFSVNLSLSKMPKTPVKVTVESSNPQSLKIMSVAGGTMKGDKAEVTFSAGSPVTTTFAIMLNPLDGLANGENAVTLTASAPNTNYATDQHTITVSNKDPQLADTMTGEDGKWVISGFTAMTESSISWTAKDVGADLKAGMSATLEFGDGSYTNVVCNQNGGGSVRHAYKEGRGDLESNKDGYTIVLILEDKDGGMCRQEGMVYVKDPITAVIQERKRREGNGGGISYTSENSQETLSGLGEGSIVDSKDTERKPLSSGQTYAWNSYYPGGGTVVFLGKPADFTDTHKAAGTNATFNSFFHVWVGEGVFADEASVDPTKCADSARVIVDNETPSFTVSGVFAREYYPEDNYADIDADKLPDEWEQLVWPGEYAFEKTGGSEDQPYGAKDNPDGDFLPACVSVNSDGSFKVKGYNFLANGPAFNNQYEVRGTHWALNAAGSDLVEPQDEPHDGSYDASNGYAFTDGGSVKYNGFYGTDPKSADTDGDRVTDGWEYFFWRQAKFSSDPIGERYDPTVVTNGVAIDNAEIEATFNPCVAAGHQTLDTDGDGLSNFEEFLLGTNPVHWDTDGDGMNDGWEAMWGLNPTDPKDAKQNPDGDFMAYHYDADADVTMMHSEVSRAFGFDPRTAWIDKYLERNRSRQFPAPNTIPFSNYYEHQLGAWAISQGFVTEVEPMSRAWMTQPVPYGASRYLDPSWSATVNRVMVPEHSLVPTSEGGGTSESGKSYTVPFGALSFTVESAEVAIHGCDSDGDGMPDGWELYLCCSPDWASGDAPDGLWPMSVKDSYAIAAASARDASTDIDGDALDNLHECHSTELCDYYGKICTNNFVNANGNWFNKWMPSNPFDQDTDGDGLIDGWEGDNTFRYQTSYDPIWNDAHTKFGVEWQLAERFGKNTMKRGHVPGGGLNPCSVDTDMDYLPDYWEWKFAGTNRDTDWEGGFCNKPGEECALVVEDGKVGFHNAGGGMDGTYFDSRVAIDEVLGGNIVISNQVNYVKRSDGIYRDFDFDHDGLENYQEYLINGVRHFQYDKWQSGLGYGGYDIQEIFNTGLFHALGENLSSPAKIVSFETWGDDGHTPTLKEVDDTFLYWDWARYADDWQNEDFETTQGYPFSYMPPEDRRPAYTSIDPRLVTPDFFMPTAAYASTDPRLADSDGDNMDDYYEMFHGLNPILSKVADYCGKDNPALGRDDAYDFRAHPWMAGMPNADPDYDDKQNWEEALSPSQPAPANHNTDPSPLWMTDMSYENSFVNLYYNWGTAGNFWTSDGGGVYDRYPQPSMMFQMTAMNANGDTQIVEPRPAYMFSFECNEGFDTDNDNIPDAYEVNGFDADGMASGVTDPLNPDRPMTRKSLYLDGNSAARTRSLCAFGPNALRSFTVEAWVMPDGDPSSRGLEVVVERPVEWTEGNFTTESVSTVRRNFRLGLRSGRPFVEYDNGGKNLVTESADAPAGKSLEANRWTHLAAVMDGFTGSLSLYVDGVLVASKATKAIPYTGFTSTAINPVGDQEYHRPTWAPIVIGASDANPAGKVDGGNLYNNGRVESVGGGQPQLSNFFKGWVDEVRIWDGARPAGEDAGDQRVAKWGWPTINDDIKAFKRYGLAEVLASRNETVKYFERLFDYRKNALDAAAAAAVVDPAYGASPTNTSVSWTLVVAGRTFDEFVSDVKRYLLLSGGEDEVVRFPPVLLCAYSFDTLPDPACNEPVQPAMFATVPVRPADYATGTPWLSGAADKTEVYTDDVQAPYQFPQYIQNWVAWLPISHLVSNGYDTVYNNEISPGSRTQLYVLQADATAHSKYWTRNEKGGKPLTSFSAYAYTTSGGESANGGLFNNFPNSANPYGYRYETGLSVLDEVHPATTMPETYDPNYAALFNDLLPLRNAVADMATPLWDDPDGNNIGVNADTDGDGLPDYFELAYGLDPDNPDQNGNGVLDAFDDFDGDNLNNYAEYLAGTNPKSADTDGNGVLDYYDLAPEGLTYGELYSDNDHVLDSYEEQWDTMYASPLRYDEHLDRDDDGWDNWSEALEGTSLSPTADGGMNTFPMPSLAVTLDGQGGSLSGTLVVHAYTDSEMNGWPNAVLATNLTIGAGLFPITITLTQDNLIFGHLRQGANWFYAWVEQDGSKIETINGGNWPTWTPGEPAAVADYQSQGGIEIGWDYNPVSFRLTDQALGYVRFNFATGDDAVKSFATDGRNHLVSLSLAGTFFSKTLLWPRTWIHEGDLQSGKSRDYGVTAGGFDASGIVPTLYDVYVDNIGGGVATNWYRATALGAPTLEEPSGLGLVYAARPEFRFILPDETTEFQMTIKKGSTEVYSARLPVPAAGPAVAGKSTVWQLPASVALDAGATYTWTVTPYNVNSQYPQFGGSTPASGTFVMASATDKAGRAEFGGMKALVSYPTGWAYKNGQTPKILVGAFRSASFNDSPDGLVTTNALGEVTFSGLPLGRKHYLMAFIDQNNNGKRDVWEPWGYYRAASSSAPFAPVAVTATSAETFSEYEFVLNDPDTDNDLMPDSVEYVLYGGSHPNDFLVQTGLNSESLVSLRSASVTTLSSAFAAAFATATGDADGDGISDADELFVRRTNAANSDTDGDGIDDGDEETLFGSLSAANETQTLKVTGISLDENGNVSFTWGWDNAPEAATMETTVESADAMPSGGMKRAAATASITGLRYVIKASDSLSTPIEEWSVVKSIDALTGETSGGTLPESTTGAMFFRVVLEK